MPPGTFRRARSPEKSRSRLSVIVAVWCLIGGGFVAHAGQSAVGLPDVDQPAAPPPSGDQIGPERPGDTRRGADGIADPLNACERAGVAVEQASGLPSGLLLAIGRVESGRWDDTRGRITPWPWTINAAGKGLWFTSKDAAALTVRDLLSAGTRSIDVGCFQISLLWHPMAFASLEQAFDPDANAAYAARFLLGLFSQTGSWDAAVEAYHSADPALGFAYRQQVFSTWAAAAPGNAMPPARRNVTPMLALAYRPTAIPEVIAGVRVWTPMPFGTASGVVAMPGSESAEPSGTPTDGAAPPLPVVSYHVMPAGFLAALATRGRSARIVSANVRPHR
jgi:hypothetical protein